MSEPKRLKFLIIPNLETMRPEDIAQLRENPDNPILLFSHPKTQESYVRSMQFQASMDWLHTIAGHTQEQIGEVSQGLLDMAKGEQEA